MNKLYLGTLIFASISALAVESFGILAMGLATSSILVMAFLHFADSSLKEEGITKSRLARAELSLIVPKKSAEDVLSAVYKAATQVTSGAKDYFDELTDETLNLKLSDSDSLSTAYLEAALSLALIIARWTLPIDALRVLAALSCFITAAFINHFKDQFRVAFQKNAQKPKSSMKLDELIARSAVADARGNDIASLTADFIMKG